MKRNFWDMSVQSGVYLAALGGFFWISLIGVIWMLLYSYGEQDQHIPALSK